MRTYEIKGTYEQSGETERFRGELGVEGAVVKGQIDDIDQSMIPDPERRDLRNKVVEGEAYPVEGQLYFVKRGFEHALRNVQEKGREMHNPQEVHVLAEASEEGIEGEYNGIWTINDPGELPLRYLGDGEEFELRWQLEPDAYETREHTAEEVIQRLYDGTLPEEPEDINTEQEISRGTTNFHIERLEGQTEDLPMDVINVALNGGVEDERRVTNIA